MLRYMKLNLPILMVHNEIQYILSGFHLPKNIKKNN